MTVLAWLLLCVTVIQLGQGDGSIRAEYGISTVPSGTVLPSLGNGTNTSNSTFPSIDRSQIRRSRRSADLDDALKAFNASDKAYKEADKAYNLTKTESDAAEKAKEVADKALSDAKEESRRTGEALTAAAKADGDAATAISEAETKKAAADDASEKADNAYTLRSTQLLDPINGRINALETELALKRPIRDGYETDYSNAKKISDYFSALYTNYTKQKADKSTCESKIQLYETNNAHLIAKTAAEKKIQDNDLEGKFKRANTFHETKKNERSELDKNEILKSRTTELDKTSIKELITTKTSDEKTAEAAYTAEKTDAAKKAALKTAHETAQKELVFAQQLQRFDNKKTVAAVREDFKVVLRDAIEYKDNEILNGANKANFGKKTIKDVLILMQGALNKAKSEDDPLNTDAKLQQTKNKLEIDKKELDFLTELFQIKSGVSIKAVIAMFQGTKTAAEKTITLCDKNEFLNGMNKENFNAETIADAVIRKQAAFDNENKLYNAADPEKKKTLQSTFDKAKNELAFIKELETAFDKNLKVEEAKKKVAVMKQDANKVITQAKTNDFFNGQNTNRFNDDLLGQIVPRQKSAYDTATNAYNAILQQKANVANAAKDLKFIQQAQKMFGEDKVVEDLKGKFITESILADKVIKANSKNYFLNGGDKKFDQMIVAVAIDEQNKDFGTANTAREKGKGTPQEAQLKQAFEKAEEEQIFLGQVKTYDKTTIGELKKNIDKLKAEADQAINDASETLKIAKKAFDDETDIITKADEDLKGVDFDKIETEGLDAKTDLKTFNAKIATYTADLNKEARKYNFNEGEAEWAKAKLYLDGETDNKFNIYDPVNTAVTTAEKGLTKEKETNLVAAAKTLADNEGKLQAAAKTAQMDANTVLEKAKKARKEPVDLEAQLAAATTADQKAKSQIDPLAQKAEEANKVHLTKKNVFYEASVAKNDAREKLDQATRARTAAIKKDEEDKATQARKDQEFQAQVKALTAGFGVTGGIVLLAIAVGLSVFFIRRKKKKEKKAKVPKEPKREELAADNGLTIIRREGQRDQYVVKGCDFNIKGPLVRAKVHNVMPTKHLLDDQVGGDKIEKIFFDKALNDAYFIGEGVEIMEEDSVSVSGKRAEDATVPDYEGDLGPGASQKFLRESKTNEGSGEKVPAAKKSSKSKRAAAATPPPALNPPPSSTSDDQDKKKASTPSN